MTVAERIQLRDRRNWDVAISAAVNAGLATTRSDARKNMDAILENHSETLKAEWLRQRGGIKGWQYFLRSRGFEEALVVKRIDGTPKAQANLATDL